MYLRNTSNSKVENVKMQENQYGIKLDYSNGNQAYNNDFINNQTQAYIYSSSGNVFNLPAPTGGNYWDNFDKPSDGCNNANNDDFCDSPFVFEGGQDSLPWTNKSAWVDNKAPSVAYTGPLGVVVGSSTTITGTYLDPDPSSGIDTASAQVRLSRPGYDQTFSCTAAPNSNASGSISCNVTGLSTGRYNVKISIKDNMGNEGSANGSFVAAAVILPGPLDKLLGLVDDLTGDLGL